MVGGGAAFGALAGLAALLAYAVAAVILVRPVIGLLILAAVAPAVSGVSRGLPVPGLRLSEIIVVGISILILLRVDGTSSPRWRAFDWAALAYVAGTAAIGAANVWSRGDSLDASSLGTLLGPIQFLLLYRATLAVLVREDRRAAVLRAVLLAGLAVSIVTLLQRFAGPGFGSLLTQLTGVDAAQAAREQQAALGEAETTLRVTGPFPHWQVLAGYLLVVGLLNLGLLFERDQRIMSRRALIGTLALTLTAMVATGTFATTLGLIAAALMLGFWHRQLGRVLAFTMIAAGAIGALFWETIALRVGQQYSGVYAGGLLPQSVSYRLALWQEQILPILDGRWLTGYGPTLPPGLAFPFTENVYLTLLIRGGVILLGIYGLLMLAIYAAARRDLRHVDLIQRTVARVLVLLVILLIPFHLLEPYFVVTGLSHLFWILAAVLLASSVDQAGRSPAVSAPPGETSR